jgi:uncharacterized membrane protein affecting hemolysin expression
MKRFHFALACMLAMSCAGDKPGSQSVTEVADPSDVADQKLMVALAQAKNFHHKAKVYMSDGNLVAATASVRQVLSLDFPPNAAEAEDVRLDARALLAKLLVSQNQVDEAMKTVQEGLAQATRDSFFKANLYTVKGEIHEARASLYDADAATKAKAAEEWRAAIQSYDNSIQIDTELQKKLMEAR